VEERKYKCGVKFFFLWGLMYVTHDIKNQEMTHVMRQHFALVATLMAGGYARALAATLSLTEAIKHREPESKVLKLITHEACMEKDMHGRHALHYAVDDLSTEKVILTLIAIAPVSCAKQDMWGYLPLHYAVFTNAKERVVQRLVEEYPKGVQIRADDRPGLPTGGVLPSELITDYSPSVPLRIKSLLKAAEASLADDAETGVGSISRRLRERRPLTTFMALTTSQPRLPEEELLARMTPAVCSERDEYKRTPLHVAALAKVSERAILKLISLCPDAVQTKDEFAYLPLHYALWQRVSDTVVRKLLDVYPEGLRASNAFGFLPLHFAARFAPTDVIAHMLMHDYEALIARDTYVRAKAHDSQRALP
jgi:ankyrin repeat protein